MMAAVAVVVAEYAAIILSALFEINVGKAVSDNLAVLKPNLLFQHSPFSFAPEAVLLNARRTNRWRATLHDSKSNTDRIYDVLAAEIEGWRWSWRGPAELLYQPGSIAVDEELAWVRAA
jgi:hypothetical protein